MTPLKALTALRSGIPAIPLNHNLLIVAKRAGRDVWEELASGRYALVAVSPELLLEIPFDKLLRSPSFFRRVLFVDIDEFHCIEAKGSPSVLSTGKYPS